MAALSLMAARRLPQGCLPMQWGWRGRVSWTAPRGVALSFTPLLAAGVLLAISILVPGAPLTAVALALAAGHGLHLWLLLQRTGRRAFQGMATSASDAPHRLAPMKAPGGDICFRP